MVKQMLAVSMFLGIVFIVCWFALPPIFSSFTMLRASRIFQIGSLVILVLPLLLIVLLAFGLYFSGNRE